MYILNTAFCRTSRRTSRWVEVDLANVAISTLRTTYADVWLLIVYLDITEPKALRLDSIIPLISTVGPTMTVQQWLTSMGNTTLPFTTPTPEFNAKYVNYTNAWHAGYTIQPVIRGGVYNPLGSSHDKEDLLVTRSDLLPEFIAKNALFSVNGLFHMTDYNSNGVYVMGGNRSLKLANDNQIGIHSFNHVGEVQCVPITEDMIRPLLTGIPLYEGVYIHFPDTVDLTNKSVLLVMGGYMHINDNVYFPIADYAFRVNPSQVGLLDRIYDSYKRLDLSSLGLTEYENNPSLIETESLISDEVILAYLTLEQSFFVVVDCPTMFHEVIPLDYSGIADRYIDFTKRFLPVVGSYGRIVEHHRIHEDGMYVIAGSANRRYNYHSYTHDWMNNAGVDSGLLPATPSVQSMGYLRLLGTEK